MRNNSVSTIFDKIHSLKIRLGIPINENEHDDLLFLIWEEAEEEVLGYTRRESLEDGMITVTRDLAIIRYNRMGTEGEVRRQENGVTTTFHEEGLPPSIAKRLERFRYARVRML